MQKFMQRRLIDGVFFVVLVTLLGGFAILLRIQPGQPSGAPHLILQAQAWLHGRLDLGMHIHDSIVRAGKVYLIYPPLPALLMIPFVAILGTKFSDIWFTWIFAALNIVLLFRTLEVVRIRRITNRIALENFIIAITFGFGTIALWLCLGGQIWFTIQTVSMFGIMLTLHSTFSRHWPLATLGVGLVALTRTSETLIGLVPLVVYLHDLGIGRLAQQRRQWLPEHWPTVRELTIMLAPFVTALFILLIHNKLYLGSFLSTGYDLQNQQNYPNVQYGVISWHYIWPNFVIDFLRWPSFSFTNAFDTRPHLDLLVGGIGTNIFFSTPLLALFLFAPQGKTSHAWLRNTLWGTIAFLLLTILTFCAAGWYQVGARYLFPLYPLLFLLLALRAAPLDTRWIGLAGLSVFINLLLAHAFWYKEPGKLFILSAAGVVLVACVVAIVALRRQRQQHEELASLTSTTTPAEPAGDDESTEKLSAVR